MMNRIIISNVHRLLATAAVCLALGACSGEESDSMPQVPANPDALCTLTPHAVEICPVDASATPLTRSSTGDPEQKATYAENLGHNFSAEATLEAEPQGAQTRAGDNLAAGAQYRIVVFDSSGAIVGNVVYKQGSTIVVSGDAIKLKAGTYRLFAYTFNSTSAIRGLDADNRNVTVNSGEDFMTYTEATYIISSTDYGNGKQLNISFTRQCARLTVTIIVEEYTDNTVTAATLDVGNVFGSGSKWDGATNTDASTLPSVAGTASLTKASANASTVDCGPSADNKYLITPPCSNQTINISDMGVVRAGAVMTYTPFTFPNPVTLVKGGSYQLTIHTGNYYVLTRTNPVTIGGVKWARTNLQQTGSGVTAPVSFVTNPWDYGSYWNWGVRDATSGEFLIHLTEWEIATQGDQFQNPCRSLGSGWRLPTDREQTRLMDAKVRRGIKVKINGEINIIGDFGFALYARGAVFQSGYQVIFLPAAGYRDSDGSMNIGGNGRYWSSMYDNYNEAFQLGFWTNSLSMQSMFRGSGYSLRCVQD